MKSAAWVVLTPSVFLTIVFLGFLIHEAKSWKEIVKLILGVLGIFGGMVLAGIISLFLISLI